MHLERHKECLVYRRGTTPAANSHRSSRLVLHHAGGGIAHALYEAQYRAVGLTIVGGRANDNGIALGHQVYGTVAEVVIEDTMALPMAVAAGHTAVHRLSANLQHLAANAVFLQLLCSLRQGKVSVAILARATIDKEYFHIVYLFVFVIIRILGNDCSYR